MKKIITGVKPTGASMHLGNLMGAVLPFKKASEGNDSAIFIADLHALTTVKDGQKMRDQSFELAVEYFAIFGIDSEITIFRQSDITQITKLMWILANVTPYSLMLRAHSFKDMLNKGFDSMTQDEIGIVNGSNLQKRQEIMDKIVFSQVNMWTFNYPILMAADILGYGVDGVPVGKDQIQHLEMTRDIARNFNKTYNTDIFIEPEAIIAENVATLPGIDGRKMSKSYDNFIGVFDDEKILKKRIMSIVSGSEGLDEKKKNPDECNIFNLYKVFASDEQIAEMRKKYNSENIGFGYGHAKTELFNVLMNSLKPYRDAREKLLQNPEIVEQKLAEWAKKMNARLDEMMKKISEITGLK